MSTSTVRHAAAAVTAAGLLVALSAAPALAQASTAQPVGAVAGYENVYQGEAATIEQFRIEGGDTVEALCIEFGVPMNDESAYTAIPRDDAGVSGIGRAAWIGANHANVGTPLDDVHLEAVATQLAAWSFTDGLTYTKDNLNNTAARDRAAELIAAAGTIDASPADYAVAVEVSRDGNAVVATATMTGDDVPLAGQDLTFVYGGSAEGEIEATTDATGTASVSAPGVTGEGVVTVTWSGALKAGSVLRPDDGGQMFVTTQDAAITRTAKATFAAVPAPEPTDEPTTEAPQPTPEPTPDTTPEPTPEPTPEDTPAPPASPDTPPASPDVPEELPYTGPEDALLPLGILTALGAAGYGWHLRRKAA